MPRFTVCMYMNAYGTPMLLKFGEYNAPLTYPLLLLLLLHQDKSPR